MLTFSAYRLVRIQTYDLQQDVMIQQDLVLDEGMLEAITKTTLISNDNFSDLGKPRQRRIWTTLLNGGRFGARL